VHEGDNFTAICEPIVYPVWDPQHLQTYRSPLSVTILDLLFYLHKSFQFNNGSISACFSLNSCRNSFNIVTEGLISCKLPNSCVHRCLFGVYILIHCVNHFQLYSDSCVDVHC
jgi:hypothetical protein